PQEAPHRFSGCPKHILYLPIDPHIGVHRFELEDGGTGRAVLGQVRLVHALLEARAVVIHVRYHHAQDGLGGARGVAPVPHAQGQLVGVALLAVQRAFDNELRLLLSVRGVGHLQLEHAAPTLRVVEPPLARVRVGACRAQAPHGALRAVLDQLVPLDPVAPEVPVRGGGEQVQRADGPVLLHGEGEHGRGKGRRVIVDVQDDDFSFKQVHPALRGADHGHLEVNKTLVLVENHLTLLQLLAVDPSLVGAQVPGDVVNLEVVGAGLERKRHLAGPGYDAQVGGYIPHAYVRGTLLGQAVAQHLLCHRGLTQQLQQEPAVAYTVHCGRSPHRSGMIFHSKKIKGKNISNKKKNQTNESELIKFLCLFLLLFLSCIYSHLLYPLPLLMLFLYTSVLFSFLPYHERLLPPVFN
uniref:Uncharacterized protein n=1 Tax=Astyanax mexicanus TaxID=7994 RepID=A0A3B1JMB5_ASTMX